MLGGDGTGEENPGFLGPRWERYHQTKLANCAFTYGLKQKLEEAKITNINTNWEGCEKAVGAFSIFSF